jgi:hypothetical protein
VKRTLSRKSSTIAFDRDGSVGLTNSLRETDPLAEGLKFELPICFTDEAGAAPPPR